MKDLFITKDSFRICAGIMGYETVRGLEFDEKEFSEEREELLWEEMKEAGAIEQTENGPWKVSALMQMMVNMMTTPEVWLHAADRQTGMDRYFYFRDYYYLFVEEREGILSMEFLPRLELVIGAYAEVLEGINKADEQTDIIIEGDSPKGELVIRFAGSATAEREMDFQIDDVEYTEVSCTNEITGWILRGLEEVETDEQL